MFLANKLRLLNVQFKYLDILTKYLFYRDYNILKDTNHCTINKVFYKNV